MSEKTAVTEKHQDAWNRGHASAHRRRRPSALDTEQARKTIPRNADGAPAVDEHLWTMHLRWARTGNTRVRDELFEAYRPLAEATARRLYRGGVDAHDLRQVAYEALLVALNRFDPARGVPFVGYAMPTIVGSLKRYYRDMGWSVHVPRRVHELAGPVAEASDRLARQLQRPPTASELATALGLELDELLEIQDAMAAREVRSLDAPLGPTGATPTDRLVSDADDYERVVNDLTLADALKVLDERQRSVLRSYYLDGETQTEIAATHQVSQMQISRWLRQAVSALQHEAASS